MKTLRTLLLCLIIAAQPLPVQAWSEGGHHIITVMAFRLLTDDEQAKILKILEYHPRLNDDFSISELPESERTFFRVGRIGYWPDVARRQPKYHRSTWHYELGSSLTLGDKSKLPVPDAPGPLPQTATLETQDLYIAQALNLCFKSLSDPATSPSDRAIALCWTAHLVADSHQPCHAGSLYAEGIFEEKDGDRGANRIITKQSSNMHALWDGLLGRDYRFADCQRRIFEITNDQELIAKAKQSVSTQELLLPATWIDESKALAKQFVYTDSVVGSLKASVGIDKKTPLELDEAYLKSAGRVAQQRAAEAAYRLAARWKKELN